MTMNEQQFCLLKRQLENILKNDEFYINKFKQIGLDISDIQTPDDLIKPVSYTHLDVYKRQLFLLSKKLCRLPQQDAPLYKKAGIRYLQPDSPHHSFFGC